MFSISPHQLGLVFPARKLCALADFLLVNPQACAPVVDRSRSVLRSAPSIGHRRLHFLLLPWLFSLGYFFQLEDFSVHRCNWSCLHQFCSRLCMCSCFVRWRACLAYFPKLRLRLNLPAETATSSCSVLPPFVSLLLDCVCVCLQVDVGLILEPPDQRLEFSSFSSCFVCGLFVTHMRCSIKYVWDSSSDFGHRSFTRDFSCINFYLPLRFQLPNPVPRVNSFPIAMWS
jgi:hypothetical protein